MVALSKSYAPPVNDLSSIPINSFQARVRSIKLQRMISESSKNPV